MKKYLVLLLLLFIISCEEDSKNPINNDNDNNSQTPTELAMNLVQTPANSQRVDHFAYYLSYNEEHEQADYVAYQLLASELADNYGRTDDFREDPLVTTQTANDDDYKGSGYDRGHLMPAADCAWNLTAMTESFYYSNITPQNPSFNRGLWLRLENQVREWAIQYDSLYVITAGILNNELVKIGDNQVSVPNSYYKILLYQNGNEYKSIAFIMDNENSQLDLISFANTIDDAEEITGLDFFGILNDEIENQIESEVDLNFWFP